jgi:hypothetical protein
MFILKILLPASSWRRQALKTMSFIPTRQSIACDSHLALQARSWLGYVDSDCGSQAAHRVAGQASSWQGDDLFVQRLAMPEPVDQQ